ncbi:MAG: hypothetical protein U0176_01460 [Bacteroidia bacterium]
MDSGLAMMGWSSGVPMAATRFSTPPRRNGKPRSKLCSARIWQKEFSPSSIHAQRRSLLHDHREEIVPDLVDDHTGS